MSRWKWIKCLKCELSLDITLQCGQSFRWRESPAGEWTGVIGDRVWVLKQTDTKLFYQVDAALRTATAAGYDSGRRSPIITAHNAGERALKRRRVSADDDPGGMSTGGGGEAEASFDAQAVLRDYFQLSVSLVPLYKQWCAADENLRGLATAFRGVRMLRQDPVENLFSFICSSNNNIARITSLVEKLCEEYGEEVGRRGDRVVHAFPAVERLAGGAAVERRLRELGFGYRARYIAASATYISRQEKHWLHSLRHAPYADAKRQLMNLTGVGAKVADCVCLMSLDKTDVVPVDTHVWKIATAVYIPSLKSSKSLTKTNYNQIADFFRQLWGEYAGWAHSIVFSADLKKFQLKSVDK